MNWKAGIIVLAGGLLGGCFSPEPVSLSGTSAATVVPAIKQAGDRDDRSAIPRLVQLLEDHDPAVRFAAISALKRMTGEDLGYRYYDGEWDRHAAVQRWHQWLMTHSAP